MQSKLDTSKDQERKREKGKEREREREGGSEFLNLGLTNQSKIYVNCQSREKLKKSEILTPFCPPLMYTV